MNRSALIIAATAFVVGILAGWIYLLTNNNSIKTAPNLQDTFFDSQITRAKGKITKVQGRTLTITNSKGQTKEFTSANPVYITIFSQNSPSNIPTTDLSAIQLGKTATITFINVGQTYQVTGILYLLSNQ